MRILILTMSMGIGGAETHVLTLSEAYLRAGHSVHVASCGGVLTDRLERAGIAHTCLPLDKKSPASVLRSVFGILRLCRRESFDAVHAHGRIPAFCAGVCRRLCRFTARPFPPVTVTVHGMYAPDVPGARHSFWGDRTVAVSDDIADYISNTYGVVRDGISVIPNGVNIRETEKKPHPGKGSRIVTVSRLDRDSSAAALALCRILPDLCRKFPESDISLTVVGGGNMYGEVCKAAAEANRVIGREAVLCTGASVCADEISASADLFVGTSRAALEAMAAGVPVLLCGDAGTLGLLTPERFAAAAADNLTCRGASAHGGDPETLLGTELCRFMSMSAAERDELGEYCRETVKKHFDIDRIAAATADVLRSAADESRGGVLLCGYYGAGNAGDDASISAIAAGLFRLLPSSVRINALTRGKGNAGLPSGVEGIGAFSPVKIKKTLRHTRLLLLGGGSLLQDSTSLRSLVYYASVIRAAKRAGCRIVIWGGAGPLRSRISKRLAAHAVSSADIIFARDGLAEAAFAVLGGENVIPSADPAYLTESAPLPENFTAEYKTDKPHFIIAPRPTASLHGCGGGAAEERAVTALADFAVRMNSRYGLLPVLAALAPEDERICGEIAELLGRGSVACACIPAGALTPGQYVSLMGGAQFTVAGRLHAAVFSVLGGSGTVCLDYDPKVSGFALDVSAEAIPAAELTAQRLELAAEKLLSCPKKIAIGKQKSSAAGAIPAIAELYTL